jgi:hypothetical protein
MSIEGPVVELVSSVLHIRTDRLMVIGDFVFVFDDLTIEFCNQVLDRSVHVFILIRGEQICATYVYGSFRFLSQFFN